MGRSYKSVFFDADDTLLDYPRAERAALRACHREFRLGLDLETFVEAYRRHNSELWRAFERGETDQVSLRVERFRRLAAELGLPDLPLKEISVFYLEVLSGQRQLLPGALAAVRRLAGEFPLALITNGIASVQRGRLSASPLSRYFQVLVISEEVGFAKPDPRIFVPALRRIGVGTGEVLYVGDSVTSDMAAARNAGMDFCWFNPGGDPVPAGQAPKFVIAANGELPGCLGL